MTDAPSIRAVTVTQNTSQFAELMLRTLFATNNLEQLGLTITVLDNNSTDAPFGQLQSYLAERGIPLIATGFPYYVAAELHGAALTRFVCEHPDCTHYLFLDADMWFIEADTIPIMLEELRAAAPRNVFGNHARIQSYYDGLVYEGRDGVPGTNAFDLISTWPIEFEGRRYANRYMPRCSPVCSLITNTPLFRSIVEKFGLSQAIRFGIEEVFYHDTFSLMTEVMATHGQRFMVSAKTVNHFTQTAYLERGRTTRDDDCRKLLAAHRAREEASASDRPISQSI